MVLDFCRMFFEEHFRDSDNNDSDNNKKNYF